MTFKRCYAISFAYSFWDGSLEKSMKMCPQMTLELLPGDTEI